MPTTPHAQRIQAAVSARFPDARYGKFNCRRRNAINWSQHAASEPALEYYSNAIDIVHKDHGYGDTSPAHQAWLDRVHAFLVVNFDALELNELIWRKRNHFDHIHTSAWPKMYDAGWYTPPCKGGSLVTVDKDGTRGDTFGTLVPPPPPTMEANMLSKGSEGRAVVFYQEALMEWDDRALPEDGADGKYGDETVEWVNHFTFAYDLEKTGIIDGVVGDLLGDYHPSRAAGDHSHPLPGVPPHDHDSRYAKVGHPHTVGEATTVT